MSEQLFSVEFHSKLKKNVERSYRDFIEDLRHDFQRGFETDVVDSLFLEQLNDIIHDEAFDRYTDLNFYWLNLVDNLIYVIQLHEELLGEDEIDSDELSALEDELFEFWNDSELAESFLNFTQDGLLVIEASNNLIPLLENQIISFYIVHINTALQEFSDPLMYQIIPELGDSEKRIFITSKHLNVDLKTKPATYPVIPLLEVGINEKAFAVEINDKKEVLKISSDFIKDLKVNNKSLFVIPQCEDGEKKLEEFKKNILKALNNIQTASPLLLDTFTSFTHTIIPVNEAGIVSYSMQSLPGYSCINMFDRDQIDLMDDLLHENGHHYLNVYLNHVELIEEDDDEIYYSPWRKALRPIRGIYHAVLTFYWAMELFANLNKAIATGALTFTKVETIKIKKRFLEEYFMLDYCRLDLKHAFKNKKVNKDGMVLVDASYARIDAYALNVESTLKELKELDLNAFNEVSELKKHLDQTRTHYKLI